MKYFSKTISYFLNLLIIATLLLNVTACAQSAAETSTPAPVSKAETATLPPADEATAAPVATEPQPSDEEKIVTPSSEPIIDDSTTSDDNFLEDESSENVIITFAGWEYDRSLYEPLMEKFHQEYPNITVQFAAMPESNQPVDDYDRLQASTGDTSIVWGIAWVKKAYYRDLQPLLDADTSFETDDFWPGALEACMDMEGRQLGVPLSFNLQGVYYNREVFDTAGVEYPKPGWTFDDLRKIISSLAKQDGENIRYGLAENYSVIVSTIIENLIEDNEGEIDPQTIQNSLQWYFDLIKVKAIYPPLYYEEGQDQDWQKQWEAWQALFQSDYQPALWTGGLGDSIPGQPWEDAANDPLANTALKTNGFLPYPVATDGLMMHTTPLAAQCAVLSAGSQHPRAAWAWLNFLSRQRLVRDPNNPWERFQLPARISVADAAKFWQDLPEGLEESIRFALDHAWLGSSYSEKIGTVMNAVNKAAAGKADFLTALAEAQTQLAAMLTPSPTPNTTPIVVATPRPTLSADAVVVNYLYNTWGEDAEKMKNLVEAYNQQQIESGSSVAVKLSTQFNGTSGIDWMQDMANNFDCFTANAPYWPAIKTEAFLNLNSLADQEGSEFLNDFDPAMLDSFRNEGALYAVPAYSQPQIMAYNADLLARRGLQPPGLDWTFDDFMALASKVASTKESDKSYGIIFEEWNDFFWAGRNVKWADIKSDPPVTLFTSPDMASFLAWIVEQKEAGVFLVQGQDNWGEIQTAYQDGQLAFWTAQAGQPEGWYFGSEGPSYKIGVALYPTVADPESIINWSSDQGHFISSKAKDPQLCWSWIKYISEQIDLFPGIPARKSVMAMPEWEALVGKENAAVYRAALGRVQRVASVQDLYSPLASPFYTWRQEIIAATLKGEDYQKMLPEKQKIAEDYLACMAPIDLTGLTDEEMYQEINNCAKQADPQGQWGP